jgi:hypothetical protein
MATEHDLVTQSQLAFDFVQKVYVEVSYLIKELEGLFREEEDKFVIGKPAGYGITTRSSTGLESYNVNLWLLRNLSAFFVAEDKTKLGGQTTTPINEALKVIYIRILLNGKNLHQPTIYSGVLYDIHAKANWIKKFENIMGSIEYMDEKVFRNFEQIDFEDTKVKFKGKLIKNSLFELNNSETLVQKIVKPTLQLYNKY